MVSKLCRAMREIEMNAARISFNIIFFVAEVLTYAQVRNPTHHLLSGIKQTTRAPSNPFELVFPSKPFSWACVFRNEIGRA